MAIDVGRKGFRQPETPPAPYHRCINPWRANPFHGVAVGSAWEDVAPAQRYGTVRRNTFLPGLLLLWVQEVGGSFAIGWALVARNVRKAAR